MLDDQTMPTPRSAFLSAAIERGFVHQCTDFAALDARLTEDRTDEATILAQVDQIEHARATLGKARVTMLLEMRKVLTPEQQQQLAQLRQKHKRKAGGDPED